MGLLIHMIGEVSWEPNRRGEWASYYSIISWCNFVSLPMKLCTIVSLQKQATLKIGNTKTTCPVHSFVSLYALQLSDRRSWERARKSPRATLPRTWCGQAIRKHVHYSGHHKQEIHPPMYGRQRIKSHTSQLILLRCATIYSLFFPCFGCSSRIESNRKTSLLN